MTSSLKGFEIGTHSKINGVSQLFLEMSELFKQKKADFLKELMIILFLAIWLAVISNLIIPPKILTNSPFLIHFAQGPSFSHCKNTVRMSQAHPMPALAKTALTQADSWYF